jgi:hypothetical protein
MQFSPASFTLLGSNILLSNFLNTLNLNSLHNARDHVLHPYKTGRQIIILVSRKHALQ